MYNEYALGGYLLYALTPPPKVFIDGRADMYGEQIFSDYNTIKSSGSKREELLELLERNNSTVTNGDAVSGRSLLDAFQTGGLVGSITDVPADWSTNPKYMEGFGQDAK